MEDARAAQEREADRLRHILEGAGKLPPPRAGANGTAVAAANGSTSGGDADNAAGGYRDELAVSAEVRQVSGVARQNGANRQNDTTMYIPTRKMVKMKRKEKTVLQKQWGGTSGRIYEKRFSSLAFFFLCFSIPRLSGSRKWLVGGSFFLFLFLFLF